MRRFSLRQLFGDIINKGQFPLHTLEEESPFDYFVLDVRHVTLFHMTLLFIVIFVDQKVLFRKNNVALRRFSYVCACLSIVSLVNLTCWTCWHSSTYGRSKFRFWIWICMLHSTDKTKLVNTNCIGFMSCLVRNTTRLNGLICWNKFQNF